MKTGKDGNNSDIDSDAISTESDNE